MDSRGGKGRGRGGRPHHRGPQSKAKVSSGRLQSVSDHLTATESVDSNSTTKIKQESSFRANLTSSATTSSATITTVDVALSSLSVSGDTSAQMDEVAQLSKLKEFVPSVPQLQKAGFTVDLLTGDELADKRRCQNCNRFITSRYKAPRGRSSGNKTGNQNRQTDEQEPSSQHSETTHETPQLSVEGQAVKSGTAKSPSKKPPVCRFHNGVIQNGLNGRRSWTCCGKAPASDPCKDKDKHEPRTYLPDELPAQWQCYYTPDNRHGRRAIAIDCEMGTAKDMSSELIRVTVIDFFTSEILINSLVWPDVPMHHLNTKFSGVDWDQMYQAKRERKCLYGRNHARTAVWSYINPETIVVGHSVHNDLKSLRWIHHNIVDTYIIEAQILREKIAEEQFRKDQAEKERQERIANGEEVEETDIKKPDRNPPKLGKGNGPLSLKTVSRLRLGLEIQTGNRGHDSLEDAMASRDIARWHVQNSQSPKAREAEWNTGWGPVSTEAESEQED